MLPQIYPNRIENQKRLKKASEDYVHNRLSSDIPLRFFATQHETESDKYICIEIQCPPGKRGSFDFVVYQTHDTDMDTEITRIPATLQSLSDIVYAKDDLKIQSVMQSKFPIPDYRNVLVNIIFTDMSTELVEITLPSHITNDDLNQILYHINDMCFGQLPIT